jgi:hypothetical protein
MALCLPARYRFSSLARLRHACRCSASRGRVVFENRDCVFRQVRLASTGPAVALVWPSDDACLPWEKDKIDGRAQLWTTARLHGALWSHDRSKRPRICSLLRFEKAELILIPLAS